MAEGRRVLAFDVGGTGVKAAVVGPDGRMKGNRLRITTPHPCPPKALVAAMVELAASFSNYSHVVIGFPGFVRDGVVFTAPNLKSKLWAGFPLERTLEKALGKPVKLLNDADVQGLAVISGKGLELVCTLGTGFGTAWFRDGELLPHLELAHFALDAAHDLDVYIGDAACKRLGRRRWNARLARLIRVLATVFNYDRLYLGGGNSRLVRGKLPASVVVVSNDAGIAGGAFVWNARPRRGARPKMPGKASRR